MANNICSNNNIFMTTNNDCKITFQTISGEASIEKYDLPYTFCYSLFKYLHLFAVKKSGLHFKAPLFIKR